ncbi:Gfo/Idh/MocA family oxidoreductase, partial [Candidatus Bathyarchaeota archaeon]|nr:Gfo/Idh/MocA family oxidoreductase [Candidatus Bathyarchaeota archaeon]
MKISLIGCGKVAERGHLPALKSLNEVEVIAVADINLSAARRLAKKFKIPRYYKDFHSILNNEQIDTVVITAPTPKHALIAIESAKAGKNIIIKKPLAMSLSEGYEIKKALESNNVLLSIIQNYRYFPSLKIAKYKISRGFLGGILTFYGVSQTYYPTRWTSGTWLYHEKGVLLDFTPHLIDAVLWLMDASAKSVYAVGGDLTKSSGFINWANILLELDNGVSGFLETSWLTNVFDFSIDFKGTGGVMRIDVNRDWCVEIYGSQTPLDDAKNFTKYMLKAFKDIFSGRIFDKGTRAYVEVYSEIVRAFGKKRAPIPIDDGIKSLA